MSREAAHRVVIGHQLDVQRAEFKRLGVTGVAKVDFKRDPEGRPLRMTGIDSDISERKAATQALQESEARLRGVLEGMGEGFALLDRDFRIREINAEGLRLVGRAREEIIGKTHWEAYPGSEGSDLGRGAEEDALALGRRPGHHLDPAPQPGDVRPEQRVVGEQARPVDQGECLGDATGRVRGP